MYHGTHIIRGTSRSTFLLSALAASLICTVALAQSPGTGGSVGLGVAHAPIYQGSDVYKNSAIPLLEYHWESGLFVGGMGLAGMQFSASPEFQYGVVIGADGGRAEKDSPYLKGMGDIPAQGTVGVFSKLHLSDSILLSAAYNHGSGNGRQGGVLNLGMGLVLPVGQGKSLSLGWGAALANAAYMRDYFGVSAAQSSGSAYTPSAGLRDVSLNLGLNYQIHEKWTLTSALTFTALSDAAKKSPLVRKANSSSVFVGTAYAF